MKKYGFLIVGAGLFGSVFAHEMTKRGNSCLVLDKRKYKKLADQKSNIIFGGRLAEYKYYDMHQVIASALNSVKREIEK